jgi:tRNA-dihydrouridine synthase A
MMDWTDRHCRAFHRAYSKTALLYTEMVTALAVINGPRLSLLSHDQSIGPVALQLGGSEPRDLAIAAKFGDQAGFDEINLNCGCPSDRVQSGRFGACLMAEPDLVADCFKAMADSVSIPVTIKCRIGIDDQEPAQALWDFVGTLSKAGCTTFIVHARKAWLKGLSPKENRDIPPLDYVLVHRLKRDHPHLSITLNGGLEDLDLAFSHMPDLDGVMLGRAAYHNPSLLGQVDARLMGGVVVDSLEALTAYRAYIAARLAEGVPLAVMTRHILGAFHNRPGARAFKRLLSTQAHRPGAGLDLYDQAIGLVPGPGERLSA